MGSGMRAREPRRFNWDFYIDLPDGHIYTPKALASERNCGLRAEPPLRTANPEPTFSGALSAPNQSKAILSIHLQHDLSAFVRRAREHLVRNARLFERKHGPYAGINLP